MIALGPAKKRIFFWSRSTTDAKMANDIHPRHHYEADADVDSAALVEVQDGFHDSESSLPSRVPTHSFDTTDRPSLDVDIEHGRGRRVKRQRRNSWWSAIKNIVMIRSRGKTSLESDRGMYKDVSEGERLIKDASPTTATKAKRTWWNYFVFGGISGMTILFVARPYTIPG